jgi:CBS domain-containing protein
MNDVSGLMTSNPLLLNPEDSLEQAEAVMRVAHARHWPVAREHDLVGMVSLRDLLTAQRPDAEEERYEHWLTLKTGHVMTHTPAVIHASDPIVSAAIMMHRHRVSSLPVVDGNRLIGLVQLDHLVEHAVNLLDEAAADGEDAQVARLMTCAPLATVQVLERLDEAQAIMRQYSVRHLPVMNGERLIGVLSERDILDVLRTSLELPSGIVVGEVMTHCPEITQPDCPAGDAGRLLMNKHLGVLPVCSGRSLCGVISKSDFLRYLISVGNQRSS